MPISDGWTKIWKGWKYFEGKPGERVSACLDDGDILRAVEDVSHGTEDGEMIGTSHMSRISITLQNSREEGLLISNPRIQEACIFRGLGHKGSSGEVGWLHCPGREDIMCLEPPERNMGEEGWWQCALRQWYAPVAYCDWE
jgi:hypothetical protein